jgi:hypothetical protein
MANSSAIQPPKEFPTSVTFSNVLRLHECVEKIHKSGDFVIQEWLVGMAKANLVDRIDVMPGGKCAEISHPRFLDATHSVQQDYRRSLTSFEVADILTENHRGFFRRERPVLRQCKRRGQQCKDKQPTTKAEVHPAPPLSLEFL